MSDAHELGAAAAADGHAVDAQLHQATGSEDGRRRVVPVDRDLTVVVAHAEGVVR